MTRLHPFRTLRETFNDVSTAINAAREYRNASAARLGDACPGNPLTAGIPL